MSLKSCIPLLICLFSAVQRSRSLSEERIVNGNTIGIREAPWQVAILYNNSHYCGGSILSNRIILTAAHCIYGRDPVNLTVRAGSSHWRLGGQLLEVEGILFHKEFNGNVVHGFDVGVIRLAQPLTFGEEIQPIELAQQGPKTGDAAFVSGWGRTDYVVKGPEVEPEVLQGLKTSVLDWNTCAKLYLSVFNKTCSKDTICTHSKMRGVYRGDSGGGLVINVLVAGVVSWGKENNAPAVYADVAHYYDWIQDAIEELENPKSESKD